MTTNDDNARNQAIAQWDGIRDMVAAMECDYDQLQALKDEAEAWNEGAHPEPWSTSHPDEAQELADLIEAAGDCENAEEARKRIIDDPLSVEVRSGWYPPGGDSSPAEFTILLCTGGPACRIRGQLDQHMQPRRAWIEYQDWGTPWTELIGEVDQDTLLSYCEQFYFGE